MSTIHDRCAIPPFEDLIGMLGAAARHTATVWPECGATDDTHWRPAATLALDETVQGLQFVQQPIRRVADGRICGHEILARPAGSTDSAARETWFAALEGDHEITAIDISAVAATSRLHSGVGKVADRRAISCNCSIHSLGSDAWWRQLEQAVYARGHAAPLVVELTERGTPDHDGVLAEAVSALRALGVQVSLDDVGDPDGQHVLSLFGELRPDWIKLSGRLVMTAAAGPSREASRAEAELVGYLARAHAVGATVIAEGVETPAARMLCERLGVDAVQGFLMDVPMPVH